jgi:predicted MFS family arabinose efflux permease
MKEFWSLSAAGFAATAISYGPARMAFGLFVPEFRSAFSMSTATVGVVSSLGFLGFFCGLLIAQALLIRRGPGVPVLAGLLAATAGMGVVALAAGTAALAAGIFLATSSAGFAWTPFNDAVHRNVMDAQRPAALSVISTGTAAGVAGAGLTALVMVLAGLSWRVCWAGFAIAAGAAVLANGAALRRGRVGRGAASRGRWAELREAAAVPLYFVGLVYGTNSAIYISFAADRMSMAGGLPGLPAGATPALVFICYGLFGLAGLATGRVKAAVGLPLLLKLLMTAGALSVALLAIAPGSWPGLVLSAGLQGLHVMMTSALLALWSERLFPAIPSMSFTAALLATAAGNVLGPAMAGAAWDAVGADAMFLGTALLSALAALALRGRHLRERPLWGQPA